MNLHRTTAMRQERKHTSRGTSQRPISQRPKKTQGQATRIESNNLFKYCHSDLKKFVTQQSQKKMVQNIRVSRPHSDREDESSDTHQ